MMPPKEIQKLAEALKGSGLEDSAEKISNFAKPSVDLCMQEVDPKVPVGVSRIGGTPDTPDDFEWPLLNENPMEFILQINLSELHKGMALPQFPKLGILLFFYGWEPVHDRARLIHIPRPVKDLKRNDRENSKKRRVLPRKLTPKPTWSLPSPASASFFEMCKETPIAKEVIDDNIGDTQADLYDYACRKLRNRGSVVHMLGHVRCSFDAQLALDWIADECIGLHRRLMEPDIEDSRHPDKDLKAALKIASQWTPLLDIPSFQFDQKPDMQRGEWGEFVWGDLFCCQLWIHNQDLAEFHLDKVHDTMVT